MPDFPLPPNAKEIPGHPGYAVTPDAVFYSSWNNAHKTVPWKVIRGAVDPLGRRMMRLSGRVRRLAHALILETFVGPAPPGMECCHGNGNPSDNRLENLRWDTHKSNCEDTVRHGRTMVGERNPKAKLTRQKAAEIRERYAAGNTSQLKLATEYGVCEATIWWIVRGTIWRAVA